jgi:arylsulfatase A-like enzyme
MAAVAATAVVMVAVVIAARWARWSTPPNGSRAMVGVQESPNILILLWDTVRADRIGCYGYDRPTTPHIDRFADEATLFEYVISPSPWTIPAHASIFTGVFPSAHGADRNNKWLHDDFVTLAETLRDHGYVTYMGSANPFASNLINLAQGFDAAEFSWDDRWKDAVDADFQTRTGGRFAGPIAEERRRAAGGHFDASRFAFKDAGAIVNRAFLQWLDDRDSSRPFFAFLNFMEAHAPLNPSFAERARFLTPEQAEASFDLPQSFAVRWAHSFNVRPYSAEAIRTIQALYDAALYRLDTLAGELFAALEARGLRDRTAIIFVSDHGENLNDHHLLGHEYCVYNSLLRVPLIIRYPKRLPPGRVLHGVQSIDLYPTVLDLAGFAPPHPDQVQGISLLAQLDRPAPDRALISEYRTPPDLGVQLVTNAYPREFPVSEHARWKRQLRSIESDGYKFIWAQDGRHELYDLTVDPEELTNRFEQEPERARALENRLEAWLDSFEHFNPARRQPIEAPGLPPDVMERLESLGYVGGAVPSTTQRAGTPADAN